MPNGERNAQKCHCPRTAVSFTQGFNPPGCYFLLHALYTYLEFVGAVSVRRDLDLKLICLQSMVPVVKKVTDRLIRTYFDIKL